MLSKFHTHTLTFIIASLVIASPSHAGLFKTPVEKGMIAYQKGEYAAAEQFFLLPEADSCVECWYYLGKIYQNGLGVTQNYDDAIRLYRGAGAAGYAPALIALSDMYARGSGVSVNLNLSRVWLEKAARTGDLNSMVALARNYMGETGMPSDYDRARPWLEKAAAQNNGEAFLLLGHMARNGYGMEPSLVEALKWYQLSEKAGYTDAKESAQAVTELLSLKETADVKFKVMEWQSYMSSGQKK